MSQNVYEGLFLFDGNRFARDNAALPSAVEKMIKDLGGDIKVSRLWEERRLAYPIRGQRKGAYWLIYFAMKPEQIAPLNRKCEQRDGVLRQLILKIHPARRGDSQPRDGRERSTGRGGNRGGRRRRREDCTRVTLPIEGPTG